MMTEDVLGEPGPIGTTYTSSPSTVSVESSRTNHVPPEEQAVHIFVDIGNSLGDVSATFGGSGGHSYVTIPGAAPFIPGQTQPVAATPELARDVHSLLDPIAQTQRVTAILETREGITLVGSGGQDLSRSQKEFARSRGLLPVEIAEEDAEITVIQGAARAGLHPTRGVIFSMGPQEICEGCAAHIRQIGGRVTSDTTFEFPEEPPPPGLEVLERVE
jgi:hypothetical protein